LAQACPGLMSPVPAPDVHGSDTRAESLGASRTLQPQQGFDDVTAGEVVVEINKLRSNPGAYFTEVARGLRETLENSVAKFPDGTKLDVGGDAALQQLEQIGKGLQRLPEIQLSPELARSCRDHVSDMNANSFADHIGSDNSTPETRVLRYVEYDEHCAENIAFGMATAREVVWYMCVDETQRGSLLNAALKWAGCACGSHPSSHRVAVVLFADRVIPKEATAGSRMQLASSVVHPKYATTGRNATREEVLHKWTLACDDARPGYLTSSPQQMASSNRVMRPGRSAQRNRVVHKKYFSTPLAVKPNIDPAVVKAFVHRLDVNFDDLVEEREVEKAAVEGGFSIGWDKVAAMFDEILERRPCQLRHVRAVSWDEIFAAMRARKQWVTTVKLQVQPKHGVSWTYVLTVEDLYQFCCDVRESYSTEEHMWPTLPEKLESGDSKIRGVIKALVAFMERLKNCIEEGMIHGDDQYVADFLRMDQTTARGLRRVEKLESVALGHPEKTWTFPTRPFREAWIAVFRAFSMEPTIPLDQAPVDLPIEAQMDAQSPGPSPKRNVSRRAEKCTGLPPSVAGVTMRTPKPLPQAGSVRPRDLYPNNDAILEIARDFVKPHVPVWMQQRYAAEQLVNRRIQQQPGLEFEEESPAQLRRAKTSHIAADVLDTDLPVPKDMSQASSTVHVSFDARRMFESNVKKQERSSAEQRYLGQLRSASESPGKAKKGVLSGRFYNTRILEDPQAADWPNMDMSEPIQRQASAKLPATDAQTLLQLGSHIDHSIQHSTKVDPKFSQMTADERGRQFSTYFKTNTMVDDHAAIVEARRDVLGTFVPWGKLTHFHEFREDIPERFGRFGRRKFDPIVRDKPQEHQTNQIEAKPMEDFWRAQERLGEYLERLLPPGQQQHFQTCLPKAEQADWYKDFVHGQTIRAVMPGEQQNSQLGWGQIRHTDVQFQRYSRPKGSTFLDRRVPLTSALASRTP